MSLALYYSRMMQNWLMHPPAHTAMLATLLGLDPKADWSPAQANAKNSLEYVVSNGVAVIPVHGALAMRPDSFEKKYLGMSDMLEITDLVERAKHDRSVRAVLLDIDSPGGTARGTPELAAEVRALDAVKPVVAFTDGLACSAAYYIASQARVVLSTPSATVGCVGTVVSFLDLSGFFEKFGVKAEVIRNEDSPLKGAGFPGTSLTPEQRAFIQEDVNESAALFKRAVYEKRRCPDEAMNGGWYSGLRSLSLALVDQTVTRADAMRTAQLIR